MKMPKLLALILALCMALSVSAFASAEPSAEPSGEAAGLSVEDAYVEYIHEWLLAELEVNSNMTIEQVEDEFMPLIEKGDYVSFPAEMLWNGMLNNGSPMTFEEFAAQYDGGAASGEAASGEAMTAEEAFVEYIHEWLLAELEVNSNMTIEQVEDEFMPLIEKGDYVSFPAEMLWSGMLNNGCPMTFEEFEAQYVPAAGGASGEGYTADEAGYQAYLKDYVKAVPAVSPEQYLEFEALIDAGDYVSFPVEMCFVDTFWGHTALTLDEFIAAGGVAEIPDFDPNLTAD